VAKPAQKPTKVNAASLLDTAGWPFWVITFIVFLIPFGYLGYVLRYEQAPIGSVVAVVVMAAAVTAGIFTWAVNTVVMYRAKRRHIQERKLAKKRR